MTNPAQIDGTQTRDTACVHGQKAKYAPPLYQLRLTIRTGRPRG